MDPEKGQAFQQTFGFSLSGSEDALPIAERIIILKLGVLASKVVERQTELAEIVEKAKKELCPDKCLVLYNQATDTAASLKRAESEFKEAVETVNSIGTFTFTFDYAAYPFPEPKKITAEEKGNAYPPYPPAIGMR